jgi:hypothetical protein
MGDKFEFTHNERYWKKKFRALATDTQGNEVLVGLTLEETAFYMNCVRNFRDPHGGQEDSKRYLELHNKHGEIARFGRARS